MYSTQHSIFTREPFSLSHTRSTRSPPLNIAHICAYTTTCCGYICTCTRTYSYIPPQVVLHQNWREVGDGTTRDMIRIRSKLSGKLKKEREGKEGRRVVEQLRNSLPVLRAVYYSNRQRDENWVKTIYSRW